MKTKVFFLAALLVSFMVSLSAVAQSNSSAGAGQAAPIGQSGDTGREPLSPPARTDYWDGNDPNVVHLFTSPLTTREFVRRHIQPIRDRITELDQINQADAQRIKQIDARIQQSIQLASDRLNTADLHATDAAGRAQTAQAVATEASGHVAADERLVGSLGRYKSASQTEIRFRAGQTALSKQAKDALDQMAAPLKDQRNYIIEVQGFAPGQGQAAIAASQKIAGLVVRYLVLTHQIPMFRMHVVGMGSEPVAGDGASAKHITVGMVEVDLLKNELVNSAQP